MSFVELRNVQKTYNGNFSLRQISFEIEKGEILTLMGPSGSGKTSLLRNICGLDQPDSGHIMVDGKDITYMPVRKRRVGMIFQDLALFPHMTVYDNIAYGPRSERKNERDVRQKVEDLMALLNIEEYGERYPAQISGGERQRVALARSVASGPSILLLDEPMSSLDTQLRSNVRSEIKAFAKKLDLTMIYVTHDHHEGFYMADKAGIMFNGSIDKILDPSKAFMEPDDERTALFLGYNVLVDNGRKIAFYPTDFEMCESGSGVDADVISSGFEGEVFRIHLITSNREKVQLIFNLDEYELLSLRKRKMCFRVTRAVELHD